MVTHHRMSQIDTNIFFGLRQIRGSRGYIQRESASMHLAAQCSLLFKQREQAPPHPVSNGQNRPFYIAQETDSVPKLKLSLWRSSSLVEARNVTAASR